MPSKTRTNNAAEETSEVPSSSQPSSTTSGIRILNSAIVFSYVHPKARTNDTALESRKLIRLRSIWLVAEFKISRAVEMLKMEIIPISIVRMDNVYSGQITSQHVLVDPG
ncbi:hypothetical protein C366_06393 [Cryptococcus neoformans Tu401-1]|nr:hypothetical protein C365_06449 [Cryptococcus neoformans var. grubii Bt85]OXG10891.1 hypothetical protein C366_06393 [Cryptococcus neoformans var. grubii Tu401-1]OXM75828.1 hypothetical protein C364_06377 [Cryptococcus neoformans var. grubii Bt63]